MSRRRDQDYIIDIQEAMARILMYIEGITYEEFMKDCKTQDAVVRNLEVIGEAAKNLSGNFKKAHPRIPWKDMAGVRDKMIHHYFGINYEIVWTISKEELANLSNRIKKISS